MKNQYIIKIKGKYIRSFKSEQEITDKYFVNPVKLTPNNNNVEADAIFSSIEAAHDQLNKCISSCNKAFKMNETKVKKECSAATFKWQGNYYKATFNNWKRLVKAISNGSNFEIIEYKPEVVCKKKKNKFKSKWVTNAKPRSACSVCNINFVHKHAFEVRASVYICPICITKLAPVAKEIVDKYIKENPDYMQDYNSELITGHL